MLHHFSYDIHNLGVSLWNLIFNIMGFLGTLPILNTARITTLTHTYTGVPEYKKREWLLCTLALNLPHSWDMSCKARILELARDMD